MRLTNDDIAFRSAPHKRVEKILKTMGLEFESERKFPPYRVDIYLSDWHVAVEVDGPYHSRKKDIVRDMFLMENYGLPVLRIDTYHLNKPNVEDWIVNFIQNYTEDVEARKATWLKRLI